MAEKITLSPIDSVEKKNDGLLDIQNINIEKLHTTSLGIDRIKRNLGLENDDVVEYCKSIVRYADSGNIIRKGKNWYVSGKGFVITINAYSNTIITAHKKIDKTKNISYKIHRPTTEEAKQALDLALRVFIEYEMPEYEPEALENFKLALKINNTFVATKNGKVIGMINERGGGHGSMLFVDGDYHRNGIATALMNHMADDLKSQGVTQITVNSSPFGVPFYERYGFTPTDKMQRKDGFIYLPMSYVIGEEYYERLY